MLFSDFIPGKLQEHPYVSSFVSILDQLQHSKQEIIAESLRVNNPALLMDSKWLLKKLSEYGVSDLPTDYPLAIIQQYLLNVDTVMRTRGSKIGIEFYCSLLSLGEVSIDDSAFFAQSDALLLDSLSQGYLTGDNDNNYFYLISDNSEINKKAYLNIFVKSKYFNGRYPNEAAIIKQYLKSTINGFLGFSPIKAVNFVFSTNSAFYFHKLLNRHFV